MRGAVRLPGEVFSAPLLLGDTVVVGCRDNFLYCLQISWTSRQPGHPSPPATDTASPDSTVLTSPAHTDIH